MEYHEIGERFEYDGVVLEVIKASSDLDNDSCDLCRLQYYRYTNDICPLACTTLQRQDGKQVYFKLIETKEMEKKENDSKKNDRLDNKLRWELLPLEDLEDIVRVYTAGANKYGANKWQNLPDGYQRYKAALFRHLVEYEKGNWLDNETNCIHLAQVAWNAIAMLHIAKQNMKNNENTLCSKEENLFTERKDTPEK